MEKIDNFIEKFIENLKSDTKLEIITLSEYLLTMNSKIHDELDDLIINIIQRKVKISGNNLKSLLPSLSLFDMSAIILGQKTKQQTELEEKEVYEFNKITSYVVNVKGRKILVLDEAVGNAKVLFFKNKENKIKQFRMDYSSSIRIKNILEIEETKQKKKILQELDEMFD